jgi:hypothetical protein
MDRVGTVKHIVYYSMDVMTIMILVAVSGLALERLLSQCGILKGVRHVDMRCGQCNFNIDRNESNAGTSADGNTERRLSLVDMLPQNKV